VYEEVCVVIASDLDIVAARQKGRALATELGFEATDLTIIATAISELARNIVFYARRGEILLKAINSKERLGIMVVARDEGPGISNTRQALQDGFSTSGSLGLGLPGVKRLMDEFEITSSVGHGTVVTARKWVK
jgi:serine/threonine-protein kinase RsbT